MHPTHRTMPAGSTVEFRAGPHTAAAAAVWREKTPEEQDASCSVNWVDTDTGALAECVCTRFYSPRLSRMCVYACCLILYSYLGATKFVAGRRPVCECMAI